MTTSMKLTKVEATAFGRKVDAWLDTRFERRREVSQRHLRAVARAAGATGPPAINGCATSTSRAL